MAIRTALIFLLLASAGLWACPADTGEPLLPPIGDIDATDGSESVDAMDAAADTTPDVVEEKGLLAGVAERSLGFPVGTAKVGLSPKVGVVTPYASIYPGTDGRHTDLTAKAVVLTQGDSTLVLMRLDAIGTWQDIVRDVKQELTAQGYPELSDGLIVSATHTHAGGGRVFNHFVGDFVVGAFLPGFYLRLRTAMIETAIAAWDARVPAKVGYSIVSVADLHKDRRCENGDVQDDSLGLIRVDSAAGELMAVMVNYSMHGTVLGHGDWVLSSDAPGAVEHGLETTLPDTPAVLFFQSWAGDMAPRGPEEFILQEGTDLRNGNRTLDAIAAGAAALLKDAVMAIETRDDAAIGVETVSIPMSSELFDPKGVLSSYPYGGLYCISGEENCGPDAEDFSAGPFPCIGIPEEHAIEWTWISAARIGELALVTLPGEPLTSVGVALRDAVIARTGLSDAFVLGYAQGYLAYLLHPDDWYLGGYEAAGSILGPNGAEYLISAGEAVAGYMMDPNDALPWTPVVPKPLTTPALKELPIVPALGEAVFTGAPTVVDGVAQVTWNGGDPATDDPKVSLERKDESGDWAPVLHANGMAWSSADGEIETRLDPEPTYKKDPTAAARTWRWTALMTTRFSVPRSGGNLDGTYRFMIAGQRPDTYTLTSDPFTLAP